MYWTFIVNGLAVRLWYPISVFVYSPFCFLREIKFCQIGRLWSWRHPPPGVWKRLHFLCFFTITILKLPFFLRKDAAVFFFLFTFFCNRQKVLKKLCCSSSCAVLRKLEDIDFPNNYSVVAKENKSMLFLAEDWKSCSTTGNGPFLFFQ